MNAALSQLATKYRATLPFASLRLSNLDLSLPTKSLGAGTTVTPYRNRMH
jgi:hypothetical protein